MPFGDSSSLTIESIALLIDKCRFDLLETLTLLMLRSVRRHIYSTIALFASQLQMFN